MSRRVRAFSRAVGQIIESTGADLNRRPDAAGSVAPGRYDVAMTTTDYLTAEQVAQRLGVKPKSVRDYVYRGQFPPPDQHIGRTPVWADRTVGEWLADHKRAPQ